MDSAHTWFIGAFNESIIQRLQSADGVYAQFREKTSSRLSAYSYSESLIEEWEQQLPTHQYQILGLQSSQVSDAYCEFLLKQFDEWFAKNITSVVSPGSFFICILAPFLYPIYVYFFSDSMIALIFIIVLIFLFPLFFPGYYASELLVSFLPYIAAISGAFVIITLVHFRKNMKPGKHHIPARRYFRGISFLVFCFFFFRYSKQFNHFYITEPFTQQVQTGSLKILFANIHKDNTDYSGIEKTISDNDPDMLMFVEFADHHYDHLKDFLHAKYPYVNSTTRSKKFVGSMVFSKYPLTDKAGDFPQGMRRYGYFSLMYSGQQIYFYLVHTSSPDSYDHFIMRNNQLTSFVQDFQKHEFDRKIENVVVVGDFNTTPWSTYYGILARAFSGEMTDATRRIPFLFTRSLMEFPLFQAHIDHLWTTTSLIVQNMKILALPGSDHRAFLFTLSLKD